MLVLHVHVFRVRATQIKCDKVDTGAGAFLFSHVGDIITTSRGFRDAGWQSSKKTEGHREQDITNDYRTCVVSCGLRKYN